MWKENEHEEYTTREQTQRVLVEKRKTRTHFPLGLRPSLYKTETYV